MPLDTMSDATNEVTVHRRAARGQSGLEKATDLHSAGCGVTYRRLCSLSHPLVALVLPSHPPATCEQSQH